MNSFLSPSVDAKSTIARTFGQAAAIYETQADVQKQCAQILLKYVEQHQDQIPTGAVLELGCGTGFITRGLVPLFPDRAIDVTDLSPEMIQFCRTQVQSLRHPRLSFYPLDGECLQPPRKNYGLAIAGFVIQWFRDPVQSVRQWLTHLQPGGMVMLSFPSDDSFVEWKTLCQQLHLPYTANPLPNTQRLIEGLSSYGRVRSLHRQTFTVSSSNALNFLNGMKAIGAGANTTGKRLSISQLRQLIQCWNARETITLSQEIVFLLVQVP